MSIRYKTVFLVFFLATIPAVSLAQKVIKGTVKDANSGLVLPGANIFVKNTYLGTVTNRDGAYSLSIPDSLLPVRVRVSYIGYQSSERTIRKGSTVSQPFNLRPSVHQMQKLVVTDEDPAMRIMRLVIRRKQKWRSKIHSYKALAYSRENLSGDTTIALIAEEVTKEFWSKEKGNRKIVKWRRQTANINGDYNFSGIKSLPNFYDNNTKIAGFNLVGITNPDAFKYYNFKLLGQLSRDGQTVYHIKVIPKKELQPLFKGSVYVLDKKYALLKVSLTPNNVVRFPPPIKALNLSYRQKFNNFGGPFWLPVDVRISGSIKISMIGLHFPTMYFNQLVYVNNYKVNIPLPDTLFANNDVVQLKTKSIPRDSLYKTLSIRPIPLSHKEQRAYATIDSSQSLMKIFQPTGFLARFIDFSDNSDDNDNSEKENETNQTEEGGHNRKFHIPGTTRPLIRYNRVDGLFAGLKYTKNIWDDLDLTVRGGYSTAAKNGSYGANLNYNKRTGRWGIYAKGGYLVHNPTQYHSQAITPTIMAIPNILGYENYFDYFREKAWNFSVGISDSPTNLSFRANFKTAKQTSLQTNTSYDIIGQSRIPRINPAINGGRLNALTFSLGYNRDKGYTFGVIGRDRVVFNAELSNPALGSDFNYKRYSVHADWSFDTFLKRRFFPNTLSLSLDAGISSGRLPLQRMGIVDVAPDIFSPFGILRAARFRPYEGSSYVSLNAEHNFGTVPFELLGLNFLVRNNISLIAFGGAAKTWLPNKRKHQIFNRTGYLINTTDGTHLEAGLSLNGIFDLFRIDFAKRIDKPVFLIGISVTRFQ